MRKVGLIAVLVCCTAALAMAGDDYAYPFAAGSLLHEYPGANPFATVTVIEITGADLVAQGAATAEDALALAPGAFTYHADRWPSYGGRHVRLRGGGPRGLMVYLDGVPLNHGMFATVDLSSIPADQIRLIRIYPGPAPLVFGPESGNGVVEIFTRQAAERFTTRFDGAFGDRRRQQFSFGLGDTEGWASYWVSAGYQTAAGLPLPLDYDRTLGDGGGQLDGSAFTRHHYRARFGGLMGEAGEVHGSIFFDRTIRDVRYDVVNPQTDFRRFPEDDRLGGVINWRLGDFGPFHMTGQAFLVEFSELSEDHATPDYDDLRRERHYRHLRSGAGLTPQFDFGQDSRITARLNFRQDQMETFIQDLDAPRDRFTTQRFEALLADEMEPVPWMQISFGGGFGSVDPTRAANFEPDEPVTGSFTRLGLGFGRFSGFALHMAYSQHPQFPTVEEWFDENLGNPQLDIAVIDNGELAIDWRTRGKTELGALGFWRQTRDDVVLTSDADHPYFVNDLTWMTYGATLTVETAPLDGLFLGLQGTWQTFDDPDESDQVQLIYMPEVYGSLDVRYRFSFGLGAALQLYAAGDFEAGDEVTLEPYSLTNLRLFYSYRDQVEVYAQGKNLLDVAYETKRFFPEPGRAIIGGLKLTY